MLPMEWAKLVTGFDLFRASADVCDCVPQIPIHLHPLSNVIKNKLCGWRSSGGLQHLIGIETIEASLHSSNVVGVCTKPIGTKEVIYRVDSGRQSGPHLFDILVSPGFRAQCPAIQFGIEDRMFTLGLKPIAYPLGGPQTSGIVGRNRLLVIQIAQLVASAKIVKRGDRFEGTRTGSQGSPFI